jgi:hypothetical protein
MGGQVEAAGERGGVGAVVAEPAGFVAAGGDGGEHPGAGAAGVLAIACALASQSLIAAWIGATDRSSQTTTLPE